VPGNYLRVGNSRIAWQFNTRNHVKLLAVDDVNIFLKSVRPRKTKLVRVAQQINLFALRSPTHYALNKYERANLHGFHLRMAIGACA